MNAELLEILSVLQLSPRGALTPLSGGDIAAVFELDTAEGAVVIKQDDPARLRGEAEGLRALKGAGSSLIIPEVLGQAGEWLVIEALHTVPRSTQGDIQLGEGLRELHGVIGSEHGWLHDNACGRTPQPNAPMSDGRAFQRERRLLALARACLDQRLITPELYARVETQAHTLEQWLPDASPCLVHGDLWAGNVLYTAKGPALIDPAVYRHYPEVDIAMLTLFGEPGAAFFDAYWNGFAPQDWPRREALFQLYPLLNHVLLFGDMYLGGVERCMKALERSRA
ncbi:MULTISPECIES: fructosamine kinase family protein [unclassified Halomonas]|uniref:fructosamine kinase family protein n=1 Tax=unclassified Halomonas TaxID=2609666 RepID=UPI0021E460A3|nr:MULTISPECIES: fructosamine kinase family protein [unclassified Halomonas]UYG00914.1 fructosamine kinase family protein [Halomonas sp. GD1P12]WNL38022.1 fructosamine kinase family protein [Halomonas sp. PAMB 3232]